MTWVKLDDRMLQNPKIARVGGLGFAVHVAGIVYCGQNHTDGFVPYGIALSLLNLENVAVMDGMAGDDASVKAIIESGVPGYDSLEVANLWEWDADRRGWWIHDYLKYNPSREEAEKLGRERSEAGKRGAESRWNGKGQSKGQGNSHSDSNGHSKSHSKSMADQCPGPEPVPEPQIEKSFGVSKVCVERGWTPKDESSRWAREQGYSEQQILVQTDRFVEHNIAHGMVFADRDAAWRKWIGRDEPKPMDDYWGLELVDEFPLAGGSVS